MLGMLGGIALGVEIGGVAIDGKIRVANQDLALDGAGIRTRFMFRIQIAALYVAEPSGKFAQIIKQPSAKLALLRDLSTRQRWTPCMTA
jgi:Chalcone isomerase-like